MTVRLGPFQLLAPLDAGGMASIWSGRHRESGTPVAAKLIPPGQLTDSSRTALEKEIRTAAGLDHPGIVYILDQGTIDAQASAESGGRIETGAPYLMMEFCSHTLGSLLPLQTWGELRTILASLLDALAYAHARGVVHRDLKPGNILFGGPHDLRPGLKIADFGIAHALDTPDPHSGTRKLMGTPRYMSPEQVEGDPRLLGPGTDLYALGALTFRCLTGHGPFKSTGQRLLFDHLRTPAPPLPITGDLPPALAEWVAWLLEKDVNARPASAAAALRALPAGPMYPLVPPDLDESEMATLPLASAKLSTLSLGQTDTSGQRFLPVPKSWRSSRPDSESPALRHVGRSLLGVRRLPIVGRQDTREAIWAAFRQAANRGEPVSMLVHGPEGRGRTRMLEWLCQRVRELGCATVVRMTPKARSSRREVLQGLLHRLFWVGSAQGEERATRLSIGHRKLGLEVSPLVDFALHQDAENDLIGAVVAQLLERLAALGPLVVAIDDLHHLPALATDLETWARIDGPLFVLLTAHAPDDLTPTFSHGLEPLHAEARLKLIESILPLSPTVAAMVDARTQGNPRYAVQLLMDWADQGVLIPGPAGFEAPRDLELPQSMRAIWSSRVRHLLKSLPDEANPVLEFAAALGLQVEEAVLFTACPDASQHWPVVVDTLIRTRLGLQRDAGIEFAHPAVREVLLRRAERAGRLKDHHRTIAEHLAHLDDPIVLAQRGHHRAQAGDHEAAFSDLFAAAYYHRSQADLPRALVLCDEAEAILPAGDRRLIRLKALRARTLNTSHRYTAARQEAEGALDLAEARGWLKEGAEARLQVAVCLYHRGEYPRARAHLKEALQALGEDGDAETRALALNHLAWTYALVDDLDKALPLFSRAALAHFERGEVGLRDGLLIQADEANFRNDAAASEALVDEALALVMNPPRPLHLAYLRERKVDIALNRGDLEKAQEEAELLLASPGITAHKANRARSLLASVLLRREQWDEAHALFRACVVPRELPEGRMERFFLYAGLLASAPEDTDRRLLERWTTSMERVVVPVSHETALFALDAAVGRLPKDLADRCDALWPQNIPRW